MDTRQKADVTTSWAPIQDELDYGCFFMSCVSKLSHNWPSRHCRVSELMGYLTLGILPLKSLRISLHLRVDIFLISAVC